MLLGLDFDNTLIRYDRLFHRVACERGLIPPELPAEKNRVRDYLRAQGQEDAWTVMQGEVYGQRIGEAEPWEGVLPCLQSLSRAGIAMCLVSHKTRVPYLGPAFDLHQAARDWLAARGFFAARPGLGWQAEQVFFELTKAEKMARIQRLGCTHYVDDLPEILEQLPPTIQRILFAPNGAERAPPGVAILKHWAELPARLGLTRA